MATDTGVIPNRRELLGKIAALVAASLPAPEQIRFFDDGNGDRVLDLVFESTSEMDPWASLIWGVETEGCLSVGADGTPTSWQYRPKDRISVEWAGWVVYPVVCHNLSPEMLAGPRPVGDR